MPDAYYSDEHRCWFVPVSTELMEGDLEKGVEPVRIQMIDKTLWITTLEVRRNPVLIRGKGMDVRVEE